jgi:hypothetical protein
MTLVAIWASIAESNRFKSFSGVQEDETGLKDQDEQIT